MESIKELELEFLHARFEIEIIKERNYQTQIRGAFQHILDVIPYDRIYRVHNASSSYHPDENQRSRNIAVDLEFGSSFGFGSGDGILDQPGHNCDRIPEVIHLSVQQELAGVEQQLQTEKEKTVVVEKQLVRLKTEKLNLAVEAANRLQCAEDKIADLERQVVQLKTEKLNLGVQAANTFEFCQQAVERETRRRENFESIVGDQGRIIRELRGKLVISSSIDEEGEVSEMSGCEEGEESVISGSCYDQGEMSVSADDSGLPESPKKYEDTLLLAGDVFDNVTYDHIGNVDNGASSVGENIEDFMNWLDSEMVELLDELTSESKILNGKPECVTVVDSKQELVVVDHDTEELTGSWKEKFEKLQENYHGLEDYYQTCVVNGDKKQEEKEFRLRETVSLLDDEISELSIDLRVAKSCTDSWKHRFRSLDSEYKSIVIKKKEMKEENGNLAKRLQESETMLNRYEEELEKFRSVAEKLTVRIMKLESEHSSSLVAFDCHDDHGSSVVDNYGLSESKENSASHCEVTENISSSGLSDELGYGSAHDIELLVTEDQDIGFRTKSESTPRLRSKKKSQSSGSSAFGTFLKMMNHLSVSATQLDLSFHEEGEDGVKL